MRTHPTPTKNPSDVNLPIKGIVIGLAIVAPFWALAIWAVFFA